MKRRKNETETGLSIMAVLRILRDWDEEAAVLHQRARKIRTVDATICQLLDDMVETMREAEGVGLAAPQIGQSLQAVVIEYPEDDSDPESAKKLYQIVNPEIVRQQGQVEGQEGCLSLPGLLADVERAETVTVKGLDRNGKAIRVKARDWLARILQHEIDHLQGILMLDRATQVYKADKQEDGTVLLTPLAETGELPSD